MTEVVSGGNSETWNYYYPVNSTTYAPSNIIRLRIPKAMFVADFSRAYLTLRINLPFSAQLSKTLDKTTQLFAKSDSVTDFTTNVAMGAVRNGIPAILNTATLFDIVDLSINGQTLYHDDFAQTSAKINGMNKSDEWLEANQQSFINPMKKYLPNNSQLAFKSLELPSGYVNDAKRISQKNIVIPLSSLFPCFEHVNDWPCFAVSDTLEFNLYVSRLYKYFVDLNWIDAGENERVSHYAVRGIDAGENIKYNYTDNNSISTQIQGVVTFFPEEFSVDNVMLMMPVHTPSEAEYANIQNIINNSTGYMYTFKHWNVVNYLSRYYSQDGPNLTQQVNFNVTTNNIFGVSMLALKPNTEVVFEKPYINSIQVNLGPWELAANGTHLGDNYTEGGDLLQSVLNNFGQTNLEYYQTLSKQVLYDHSIGYNEIFDNKKYHPTGSYITFWDAAPYDELGVGGNEFSNLITYKYSLSPFGIAQSEWPVSNIGLGNAKTYCCIQTLSGISITAGGVEAINPNSMNLSTTFIQNLYNYDNSGDYPFRGAHGLKDLISGKNGIIGSVIGFLPKIFTGIGKGISWIREKIRDRLNRKHFDFYRKHLTEEEINKNIDKLTHDSYYLLKKDWKRTFKEIINARDRAHGLFMRHGLVSKIIDLTAPRWRPGWKVGFRPGEKFRFTSGRLLNWTPFSRSSVKHGLCNTSHGFLSWMKNIFHRGKAHVTDIVEGALDRGKNIIQSLLAGKITKDEAISAAKRYARETGEDILNDVYAVVRGGSGNGIALPEKFGRKRMLYNIFKRSPISMKSLINPSSSPIAYGAIGKRIPMFLGG